MLVGASFAAISYLISKAVERALEITEKIEAGSVPLDVDVIAELVSKHASDTNLQLINIATYALIVCWLVGIIDAYRVGCVKNKTDKLLDK